jgi:hypothetical protein
MGENNIPGHRPPSLPANVRAAVVPLLGLAAVLAGGLTAYFNREFVGWFAYAPLSSTPFTANGAALITQGTQVGLGISAAGLLLLAFWAGYRVGSKASPGNDQSS